jgi:uncharacterized membrane protein YtjA (UPF0391 family)
MAKVIWAADEQNCHILLGRNSRASTRWMQRITSSSSTVSPIVAFPTRFASGCYPRRINMLYWAAVFFIIAIVAGIFGFFEIAAGAVSVAKILFLVFLVLFLVSLITGLLRRGKVS